jgi:hypothetical protein
MRKVCAGAAAVLAAAGQAAGQILVNGDFEAGQLEPWVFHADPNAEPAMTAAVASFRDSMMFRVNPGHDGSGGWAGGTLEQAVWLEEQETYIVSGSFYMQNLRTGINQTGGTITVMLDDLELYTATVGQVDGLAVVPRSFQASVTAEETRAYVLRVRFTRPWRNSNPVSIYHWADDLSIALPPPPPCYPNCDGSTTQPVLNVEDFLCFISAFAEGCR